ncbi:hypothetical protein VHN57_22910 [Sphingobium sp. WW5]|jgi:hypothetical protein|uniref:Uncharacterized protein n=1 Tax=Sphingobium yanoikuyae TaxID=13690 RepID=A0A084ENY2_SPHYA|nr:hypothetical protein [Sphingobium yanoikuyae]ATI82756.1 hypothetical protein A6768_23965 [Sphingobium yanoikuyae]KEZ19674.1 Hypothetical protein precursor [Sphingobium yanoikuyae]MDG2511239.1 hypothetical protein [Sphingobium yanoikuyae]
MKFLWKSAAMLGLAMAGIAATSAPAQAQHYRSDGWRGDRDGRWDGRRHWDNRRWDDRRRWRGDRRYYDGRRGYHRSAYRQRCWDEWRYNSYRDRRVRVRICR